jgi:sulfur carrier protein
MSIVVNGQLQPLPAPPTVAALLLALAPAVPFAVARNEKFVPRAKYKECSIQSGDRIDIVHPTAGG